MDNNILHRQANFNGHIAVPLIATSRAVANLPGLAELIGVRVVHHWVVRDPALYGGVVAWGRKASARVASKFAERHGLNLLRLEDGFIRSVGLGNQDPPLSIVVDDVGIYYDATAPSRLEAMIAGIHTETQQSRTRALIAAWREARISKYNHAREYEGSLPARYVLVVDQTRGDNSLRYGLADKSSFGRMLASALTEYPECTVLLKLHPDVMAGNKRGHFDLEMLAHNKRVYLLGEDVHPALLIERAEAIYTVTSQVGFEGLLWGKRVRIFGMPFYAGWGLTNDELPAPHRRKSVLLEDMVHAALVEYPRYIDPETGKRCEVEQVVGWMALQRRMRMRFPDTVYAMGFSLYKRPVVRSFFQGSSVRFVRKVEQIPSNAVRAVWGCKELARHEGEATVVRLEDGFIRSVGLGADLVRPLSWVMDPHGIYFDATSPSSLELILQNSSFDEGLLVRAKALSECLVSDGVTKYNVGQRGWQRPENCLLEGSQVGSKSYRVILVPGQVETDASLAFGAPNIRHNVDLLRVVRETNPDAYVIYKSHPDVVAGLRRKGLGECEAALFCDEVLSDVNMGELLSLVDEVHTLTSLAGFESLLRGKKVVCYGQPFYAGWGLTIDVLPVERRTRLLSLEELVAGALILYPTYICQKTGKFSTPERILEELVVWRANADSNRFWCGEILRFFTRMVLRRP